MSAILSQGGSTRAGAQRRACRRPWGLEDAGGIETRRRRLQERVRADMTQRVVGRFAWSVPSATLSLVTPLKQGLSRRFSFLRRIASKSSRSGLLKFANPCLSIFCTLLQTRLSPHTLPPRLPTHTPPSEINMSVVGVDLGTLNSVIAVARNRGVDVVSRPRSHTVYEITDAGRLQMRFPTARHRK